MINKITDQQLKILESDASIKRIIACAGSGKTSILTESIINVLKNNLCRPDEILAITFTRNAAENMRKRIKKGLEDKLDFENMDILNFNSFGNQIIRENSFELGLGKNYSLINISQSWKLIYRIVSEFNFKKIKIGKNPGKFIIDILKYIWDLKNNLVSVSDLEKYCMEFENLLSSYSSSALREEEKEAAEYQQDLAGIYKRYEEDKKLNNLIDYNDHIFLPYNLLLRNRILLERYKNKYKYIFIDEFQDTDLAQGYLISLLYNPGFNKLMIVGDDDQGIYSFRGACIENILNFHKWDTFKGTGINDFFLTVNFRSGNKIINAINRVIECNKNRFGKKLEPESLCKHSEVVFFADKTLKEEAKFIVCNIKYLVKKGVKLKDIAILARRKRFQYILEELNNNNLKYELISGKGFFYEAEILFIISWIMAIENIEDEIYILNIIQSPKYKISDRDVFYLKNYKSTFVKNNKTISLIDGILDAAQNPYLGRTVKKRLSEFISELTFYMSQSQFLKLNELISLISENSGLVMELKSRFDNESKQKLKNIETLLKISSDFEENRIGRNIAVFITYLKDVAKTDEEDPERYELSGSNSIKIMSIHAAKGLEFEVVFLPMLWKSDYSASRLGEGKFRIPAVLRKDRTVYMEKPCFSSKQKFDYEIKLLASEEERRIFYVACSRAKSMLFLSYSMFENEKNQHSGKKEKELLPFLSDILKNGTDIEVINDEGLELIKSDVTPGFSGKVKDYKNLIDRAYSEGHLKKSRGLDKKADFNLKKLKIAEDKLARILRKFGKSGLNKNNSEILFKVLNSELDIEKKLNINSGKFKSLLGKSLESKMDRKIDKQNMRMFSLTKLLDYMDCPKLYKMKYIYNIPGPISKEALKGEMVHKYIENITGKLKGSLIKDTNYTSKKIDFQEFRSNLMVSLEKNEPAIKRYIENFLDNTSFEKDDIESIFLEQEFYWRLKNFFITCKIDRLDVKSNGSLNIIDYKLSNYSKSRNNLKYLSQLKSYICGVSDLFKVPVKNIDGLILFLGNGKELAVSIDQVELPGFQNKIIEAIEGINNRDFEVNAKSKCNRGCSYKNICSR